jgi:Asp-tRNA(Asn)/Glu-tRNA(Gln) amidotransferase C subunit|tara:strand:+ start:808 stop:1062 length:255 start_codon:yes stop_codon:yes gene_type:complete
MNEMLWHKVSEKEKKDIEKQAKSIMESFSKKLNKVKAKVDDSGIEMDDFERSEGGKGLEIDRKIMFENAPEKNKDFIIAEKKKW